MSEFTIKTHVDLLDQLIHLREKLERNDDTSDNLAKLDELSHISCELRRISKVNREMARTIRDMARQANTAASNLRNY